MIDGYEWQLDFHYRENGTGKNYYKSGRVKFIEKKGNTVNAIVLDDYKFKVKIKLCDDKYVDSISCECGEQSCKHMAACLHLLSNEEVPDNKKKFREIEDIFDNLKDDELNPGSCTFIDNYRISSDSILKINSLKVKIYINK